MTRYLVDSDRAIDHLHGETSAIKALIDLAPQGLAVNLISYGELYQGAYYARNPELPSRACGNS